VAFRSAHWSFRSVIPNGCQLPRFAWFGAGTHKDSKLIEAWQKAGSAVSSVEPIQRAAGLFVFSRSRRPQGIATEAMFDGALVAPEASTLSTM